MRDKCKVVRIVNAFAKHCLRLKILVQIQNYCIETESIRQKSMRAHSGHSF